MVQPAGLGSTKEGKDWYSRNLGSKTGRKCNSAFPTLIRRLVWYFSSVFIGFGPTQDGVRLNSY
jgi:hypothetical protein